jgi:hypothetical protein
MNRLVLFLFILLTACGTDSSVKPAESQTFVRYFNGGNNDYSETVVETPDKGYLIIATTQIKASELSSTVYKIKAIKTDQWGDVQWQALYPHFGADKNGAINYSAHAVLISPSGDYILVGEDIQKGTGNSKLLVMDLKDSVVQWKKTFYAKDFSAFATADTSTLSIIGRGVTVTSDGSLLLLSATSDNTNNMVLSEVSATGGSMNWNVTTGDGTVVLANRLFIDSQLNAVWGGTVTRGSSESKIRIVRMPFQSQSSNGAPDVGAPGFSQVANDICQVGGQYAVVGSTNEKFNADGTSNGSGTTDILFSRFDQLGTTPILKTYPITGDNQNAVGNAIASTKDGGFIILGTVISAVISGKQFGQGDADYYLIKVDANGNPLWQKDYGSKFADNGIDVIQASDGSFVVLGITQFGGIRTIMLMKTDQSGNIQ